MINPSDTVEHIKKDIFVLRTRLTGLGIAAGVMLLAGATFYHQTEKLSWLDAFYFCTITLTTVGYGDITPQTSAGKLFAIFYVIIGIGIIAGFANQLLQLAVTRREYNQARRSPQSKSRLKH